jgi:hypothetical protein
MFTSQVHNNIRTGTHAGTAGLLVISNFTSHAGMLEGAFDGVIVRFENWWATLGLEFDGLDRGGLPLAMDYITTSFRDTVRLRKAC